jgi:hypothetical protein
VWSSTTTTGFTGLGAAVAGTGDIGGDGVPEVITSTAGSATESVILLDGATGFPMLVLTSTVPGSGFGSSLSAIGDLTGDGIPDVIAGAPFDAGGAGAVSVFDGATGALMPYAPLFGTLPSDNLGWSVTSLGDITGDGTDDFAAGGIGGGPAFGGFVQVYDGASGVLLSTLSGATAVSVFGISVACVGDVNGDTVPDLAVGDQQDPTGGLFAGSVRVYSGALLAIGSPAAQILQFNGSPGDLLGRSIAGAGDYNGNGTQDIVAGAIQSGTPFNPNTGSIVVFDGAGFIPVPGPFGLFLPINFDVYTSLLLNNRNIGPMTGNFGVLDAAGRSTAAAFVLPPGSGLPPLNILHAFVAYNLTTGVFTYASSAAPLRLVP